MLFLMRGCKFHPRHHGNEIQSTKNPSIASPKNTNSIRKITQTNPPPLHTLTKGKKLTTVHPPSPPSHKHGNRDYSYSEKQVTFKLFYHPFPPLTQPIHP